MKIITKIKIKLNMKKLKKSFKSFGELSGFGSLGYGNDCHIQGNQYISIGNHSWIGHSSSICVLESKVGGVHQNLPQLSIGDNVKVTSNLKVTCAENIVIEDNVLIAPYVFITDLNHGMDPTVEEGYSNQPLITKKVFIGNGVWLGQQVCVLPGVSIGEHAIIGAGSVVTHNIPPYTIAAGCPAKPIKKWNFEKKEWERC